MLKDCHLSIRNQEAKKQTKKKNLCSVAPFPPHKQYFHRVCPDENSICLFFLRNCVTKKSEVYVELEQYKIYYCNIIVKYFYFFFVFC